MTSLYDTTGSPVSVYRVDGTRVWGPPSTSTPPVVEGGDEAAPIPTGYTYRADLAAQPLASGVIVTQDVRWQTGVLYKWNSRSLTRLGLLPRDAAATEAWNALTGHGSSTWAVEFTHTGRLFTVDMTGGHVNVWVDGKRATDWPQAVSGSKSVTVDLGTTGTRTIMVEMGADSTLAGIRVPDGATIAATTTPRRKLFVYGDSWIAGSSYEQANVGKGGSTGTLAPQMRHLGWLTGRYLDADTYYAGIGGTAYGASDEGNNYAADARVAQIVAVKPDEVVVCGSINSGTDNSVGAALFYSKLRERLPSTRIVVIGRQSYGDGTNSGGVDVDIKAAADAAPNVIGYVSPRAEKWITGTGNSVSGTGQAALYHNGENVNHLTDAGNLYYAERQAQAVARLLPAT